MVKTKTTYEGGLHCSMVHEPSGATLSTDAPVDNNGKGESFSPTDLVGAALAGCMSTIMGIVAERKGIHLEGMTVEVAKHMNAIPAVSASWKSSLPFLFRPIIRTGSCWNRLL